MPFPHQRRRGATVLFRRKIPADLRDRFGGGEIVRSLGRVTPGEGRRLAHHLWSQTEVAFMFARREPGLTREEISRIVDADVSQFRDRVEDAIADVRPGIAKEWLDEPAQVAAALVGAATVLDRSLARGDLASMGRRARLYSQVLLKKSLTPDGVDERRLARAMAAGLRDEMKSASAAFDTLAQDRPKSERSMIGEVSVFECTPEDLAILRGSKVGDNLAHVMARLKPVPDDEDAGPAQSQPETRSNGAASSGLRNAGKIISELWPAFCANKEAMNEWKKNETTSSQTTLKLWIQLQGDKPPGAYTGRVPGCCVGARGAKTPVRAPSTAL